MEHRAFGCSSRSTKTLDDWRAREQRVVVGRAITPTRSQSDAPSVLHQLQPLQGLVPDLTAYHYGQLGSLESESMDRAVRRWCGPNHASRCTACESGLTVLRSSRSAKRRIVLGHEGADRLSFPESPEE